MIPYFNDLIQIQHCSADKILDGKGDEEDGGSNPKKESSDKAEETNAESEENNLTVNKKASGNNI